MKKSYTETRNTKEPAPAKDLKLKAFLKQDSLSLHSETLWQKKVSSLI